MDAMLGFHTVHEVPNEYLVDYYKLAAPIVYRSPYASQRIAEIAASIPAGLKIKGPIRKHGLIEAVRDVLPPESITRKKMGFGLPMDVWLAGPLQDRVRQYVCREALPDFVDADVAVELRDRFFQSPQSVPYVQVWMLLTLSLWAKTHLA